MIDSGEMPADAAVRELHEETGLEVALTAMLGVFEGTPAQRVVYDVVDFVMTVFGARVVGGGLRPDGDEIYRLKWLPPAHVRPLRVAPWMIDVVELVVGRGPSYLAAGWRP